MDDRTQEVLDQYDALQRWLDALIAQTGTK
jgi:hypothetical protein